MLAGLPAVGTATDIREHFSTALELLPEERATFLATLAEDVRRQVLSLLEAHDSAGSFLEPALAPAGERVGPYRLLARIAEGGMGVVYRAFRDDGEFERQVAIKLVGGRLLPGESERRFIAERQILAALDHPNIVRLIDGGLWRGQRYLVMELVEGRPITEYCRINRLPVVQRLRLFQQLCAAIQFAHQRLILHRDLKPQNILVTGEGRVKVLDFGIAKLLEQSDDAQTTLLHPLTLSCASPEQLRGETLTLGSDIYSLGLLLFELLTGTNPQAGSSRSDILRKMSAGSIPARSNPAPDLPADLYAIVRKALAPEAEARYGSAEELSADIDRFVDGRPVAAHARSGLYVAARFARRNKALVGVAAALVVAVAASAFWIVTASRRAQRRFNEVRGLAHSLLFEVYDSLNASPGTLNARLLVASRAQQYLDTLARETGDDPELAREIAESYLRLGDVRGRPYRANLGDTPGALKSYEQARRVLENELGRRPRDPILREDLGKTFMALSMTHARMAQAEFAIEEAKLAVKLLEDLHSSGSPAYAEQLALAYSALGIALNSRKEISIAQFQEIAEAYKRAVAVQESAGLPPTAYMNVAYALLALGDRTGDGSYYRKALDYALLAHSNAVKAAAAVSNQTTRRTVIDMRGTVGVLRWKADRDFNGALGELTAALHGMKEIAASEPQNLEAQRDVADILAAMGRIEGEAGRRSDAMEHDRGALKIYKALAVADPESTENASHLHFAEDQLAIAEAMARASSPHTRRGN